jgi:hypothetical protein
METTDLINFNDAIYQPVQPTIYSLEQELFETKRKLSLLEERLKKLEEQKSQSFSVIPIYSSSSFPSNYPTKIRLFSINSISIKLDLFNIYINNLFLFNIEYFINSIDYKLLLKQFQNIKLIEFDISNIIYNGENIENISFKHLYPENDSTIPIIIGNSRLSLISIKQYISFIELLLTLYKDLEIIFKATNLNEKSIFIFQEFMKSTNYRKLHIEIKDNLTIDPQTGGVSYVSQPYVNETKEHCISNNIEFTSNIGI